MLAKDLTLGIVTLGITKTHRDAPLVEFDREYPQVCFAPGQEIGAPKLGRTLSREREIQSAASSRQLDSSHPSIVFD
ncbi:MAG: hypothetical protein RLZZ502_1084 [Pseudomonadota bacterium]